MTTPLNDEFKNTHEAELTEIHQTLREAEHHLLKEHRELVDDPRNAVEQLERAGCSAHIKDLARLAMGAWSEGLTAEGWRTWIVDGMGPEAGPLVAAAETCMRTSGLWPWE